MSACKTLCAGAIVALVAAACGDDPADVAVDGVTDVETGDAGRDAEDDGDTAADADVIDVTPDADAVADADATDSDTPDDGDGEVDTPDAIDADAADTSFTFPDGWEPRRGCEASEGSGIDEVFPPSMDVEWEGSGQWTSFSSVRLSDVDGDCVLDAIVGRGDEVLQLGWVTAVSGSTGDVIWDTEVRDEPVGSAMFVDINDDGVDDVVIGGRNSVLVAIDGASGEQAWEFYEDGDPRGDGWFNFYSNQLVGDYDGDGVRDIFAANGGDATLAPFEEPRPSGRLMIISARTGEVLHYARVPDRAETYMSAMVYVPFTGSEPMVIFGTGGETLRGSLWRVSLADVVAGDIDDTAVELVAPASYKGIIAPPAIADLDLDGYLDVIVPAFDGRLVAVSGATDLPLWTVTTSGSETYVTPAIGYFDNDDNPDVIASFAYGSWPAYRGSRFVMVSGFDGRVFWERASDKGFNPSPLAVDLDDDGYDEVIIGEVDFEAGTLWSVVDPLGFVTTPIFDDGWGGVGTPAVADLDGDGWLEIVMAGAAAIDGSEVPQWRIGRYRLNARAASEPAWSGYMGTRGNGIFHATRPR
jgi:hypothetical protein